MHNVELNGSLWVDPSFLNELVMITVNGSTEPNFMKVFQPFLYRLAPHWSICELSAEMNWQPTESSSHFQGVEHKCLFWPRALLLSKERHSTPFSALLYLYWNSKNVFCFLDTLDNWFALNAARCIQKMSSKDVWSTKKLRETEMKLWILKKFHRQRQIKKSASKERILRLHSPSLAKRALTLRSFLKNWVALLSSREKERRLNEQRSFKL